MVYIIHVDGSSTSFCSKHLAIVHGFWPESEHFDSGKKVYHLKGHLKRSRMAQFFLGLQHLPVMLEALTYNLHTYITGRGGELT